MRPTNPAHDAVPLPIREAKPRVQHRCKAKFVGFPGPDWAELNDPGCTAVYEAVFDGRSPRPGLVMLDAGAGGGFRPSLAATGREP